MLESILEPVSPTMLFVIIAVFMCTYYLVNTPKMLNMPPGPFPLPVIGNLLELTKSPEKDKHVFQDMTANYGKLCSLKVGKIYFLIISDYKLLVEAYVKKANVFNNRPIDQIHTLKHLNEMLGKGITLNDGPSWKQLRKLSMSALREFGVGKQSLEEKIHEELGYVLDAIDRKKGQPFNVKPVLEMAMSNIICTVVFGSRFEYDDDQFKGLLKTVDESFSINPFLCLDNFFPILRVLPQFRKATHVFSQILMDTTDFVKRLASNHEKTYDPDHVRDFIDLFIKAKREKDGTSLTEDSMSRVIVDLFVGGSDTTVNTMFWLMLYLAKYPDVQTKCQQQIDQAVGKNRKVSTKDKINMPYLEATILEVLRVRPIGALGLCHSANSDTELGGYHIPKDTVVFPNFWAMNNDPEAFPDPDVFKPEHFLDGDGKVVNRERMVSFSIGPRVCLGESMAWAQLILFVTSILQTYTIIPEQGHSIDLTAEMSWLIRHVPHKLVFVPRDQ